VPLSPRRARDPARLPRARRRRRSRARGAADRPRARGAQARRGGAHQRADRRPADDQPAHGRAPSREPDGQARRARPRAAHALRHPPRAGGAVSVLVWVLVGIALWHFTVLLPDRFHGGIIGAFLYAVGGAVLTGYALPEPGVPLDNPPGYKHVLR